MPEAKSILVTILIAALVISGLGLLNVLPVSSAYCSVWNYAGHGSAPGYAGCNGKTSSSASSTSSLTTSSITSSTASMTTTTTATTSSSNVSVSKASLASLTLSSSSFSMAVGGASGVVSFVVQTTGAVNLTVVGASKFVVYAYCVNLQCVQNDGNLLIASAGTYQGLISASALSGATASTFTSSFEALYDNQVVTSAQISAIVGGESSNYFCVEQSLSINITRALINSNGGVYSSTPLQSLIGKPGTPSTQIVAYETTISGNPTPGASGSFLVTYEVLGTGPISTNAQGRMLTQGDGWKLFEFEQNIPLGGGSFNVYLNATDMLWGEYYAGLDANTQSLLSEAGWTGNQIANLYLIAGPNPSGQYPTGQTNGDDLVIGNVSLQGCSGQSSTLQTFQDYLYIPTVASTSQTPIFNHHIIEENLFTPPSLAVLGDPAGKNAVLIGLADSLVLAGIAVAVVVAIYRLKE